MKRYNSVYDGVYTKPNEMVEEANGDWVRWEDVEALEDKCAELESKCAELLEALEGIAGLFERDDWIYVGLSIKHRIIAARAAIAKAKGETL